jgi:RNA recognition motif-containing protein
VRFAAPEAFLTPEACTELQVLREAEAAIAASEIEVSRRLFVANIPNNASADDLRQAFANSGITVDSVTVPQDGPRNRGFGFVHVPDGQTAMKALGAEGSLRLGQRVLHIEEAHEESVTASVPRARATSPRVFVGNMPYSADATAVRRLFAEHDLTAVDVHIVVDPGSGRSRGYAFVSLRSPEEAQQAIDRLHGTRLQDRALILGPETSPRRRR